MTNCMNKYCMKCQKTTKFEMTDLTGKCLQCYTVMQVVTQKPSRIMIGSPWNCRTKFES